MKLKSKIIIVSLCCFSFTVSGQNLVLNHGFEDFYRCPIRGWYELNACKNWNDPAGTVDYFNACKNAAASDEKHVYNYLGGQEPHSGSGFIGLFLLREGHFYDREYLSAKLESPLEGGVTYKLSFYICIAEKSRIYSDRLSICFSKDSLTTVRKKDYSLNREDSLINKHEIILQCNDRVEISGTALRSKKWSLVEMSYSAKGGEEYMTFGIFEDDINRREFKKMMSDNINYNPPEKFIDNIRVMLGSEKTSYYYLDDISIVRIDKKMLN